MLDLSIVVTSYNRRKFLAQALESLLNEKISSSEVVVVDDGSTDGSLELLPEFPVRVISHLENRGQAAAQNTGIRNSTGKYVAFFDCDDVLERGGMTRRLEWLKEHRGEIVAGEVNQVIDASGKPIGKYEDLFYGGIRYAPAHISQSYLSGGGQYPAAMWLLMFERNFLTELGLFKESLRVCHDNEMWRRILRRITVPRIAVPVAKYRIHGNNISGKLENGVFRYAPKIRAENFFLKLESEHNAR